VQSNQLSYRPKLLKYLVSHKSVDATSPYSQTKFRECNLTNYAADPNY